MAIKEKVLNVFVVIDMQRLGKSPDTPTVYGSIKALVGANIEDKGEVLTYSALWNRLSRDSETHYWRNERYLIKKVEVKRHVNKKNK